MRACVRCGAPIVWVKTVKNGKPMPLDPEPMAVGNVVLTVPDRLAVVLNSTERDLALADGRPVWRAHFASCPHGKERR